MTHITTERLKELIEEGLKVRDELLESINLPAYETGSDVVEALRELLQRREADRWIPTSERYPEQYASALIVSSEGVEEAQWNGDNWYLVRTEADSSAIFLRDQVTHWRPLPDFKEEK